MTVTHTPCKVSRLRAQLGQALLIAVGEVLSDELGVHAG